jgi:hypothetical protein
VLYVEIRTGQPVGVNHPAGAGAYDLRVTIDPAQAREHSVIAFLGEFNPESQMTSLAPSSVVVNGTPVIVTGPALPVGSLGNGPFPPSLGTPGGSTPGPPPSPASSSGPVAGPLPVRPGLNAPGNPGPSSPIDARPLPGSPHEPAVGILTDGAPAERVDRVEETRVEMSLLLLLAPGRAGARHDEPSPDPSSTARSAPASMTGIAATRGNNVLVQPKLSDEPRSSRTGEGPGLRPSAVDPPLTADGLLGDVGVASSAVLPPIDESDRPHIAGPTRRGDGNGTEPTEDERTAEGRTSPGNAILLGLSGSAALGVGLYAPDLAAAARRSLPRLLPNPRTRPAASRDPPTAK